jgi:hypothetical protein
MTIAATVVRQSSGAGGGQRSCVAEGLVPLGQGQAADTIVRAVKVSAPSWAIAKREGVGADVRRRRIAGLGAGQ